MNNLPHWTPLALAVPTIIVMFWAGVSGWSMTARNYRDQLARVEVLTDTPQSDKVEAKTTQ